MVQPAPGIAALLDALHWNAERRAFRDICLDCGLGEAVKWGKLCFTHQGHNLAIFYGLKDYCGLGFVKGALLEDAGGILHRQGENSQAVRMIRVRGVDELPALEADLRGFIRQAMALEEAGRKVEFTARHALVYPEELQARLAARPDLAAAFAALTPGRQRGYVLHFSGARQAATRAARVQRCEARILAGKGLQDR
ncbi:MAG: YdeI/OmpD-associated family protein [Rhodobacteraceae bacterium]|nr:YdeI/OmpD-associated family protein [Paracoccaceae bacterium]